MPRYRLRLPRRRSRSSSPFHFRRERSHRGDHLAVDQVAGPARTRSPFCGSATRVTAKECHPCRCQIFCPAPTLCWTPSPDAADNYDVPLEMLSETPGLIDDTGCRTSTRCVPSTSYPIRLARRNPEGLASMYRRCSGSRQVRSRQTASRPLALRDYFGSKHRRYCYVV
jgi:hypothetical protein